MSADPDNVANELVDQLVASNLDWQDLVRGYPKTAMILAAAGGFALGRARGPAIVAALAAYAADTLAGNVNAYLGEDVL